MKDRLNLFLENKGFSATKLASIINANPSAISHILNGRNKPGYDLLVNFATAFPEVNMDWLLTGKGGMYHNRPDANNSPTLFSVDLTTEEKPAEKQKRESYVEKTGSNAPEQVILPVENTNPAKKIKRVLLFFEDGSFEDYKP